MCGCDPATKQARYGITREDARGILCPEHGEPMYGYRSPQVEHPGLGRLLDYGQKSSYNGLTLAEREPDRRDARDPERAYDEHLFTKTVVGNGHH